MLVLPESMREEVRKPFGKVFSGNSIIGECSKAPRPLFAVGDRCAYDLISAGMPPDMMIIDFRIKREEVQPEIKKTLAPHAKNAFVVISPAGRITDELIEAVGMMLNEGKGAVIVLGEDDLSSLLVMADAPSGTLIYGQPDEGAVLVPLGGEEIRKTAAGFLGRMGRK